MQVSGKTVFITGGGGGIGGGIGHAFAEKGAKVVLADIDIAFAETEAKKLPSDAQVLVAKLDVTSQQSWTTAKQQAEAAFGPIDILCNNAGITTDFRPLTELAVEEFARVMAINVSGVFYGIKTFADDMRERASGHIVNTSSMNGLSPFGGLAAYSASKFAVFGLSDALRDELAPFGVGVSTLFPGLTRSRMSASVCNGTAAIDPEHVERMRTSVMDPLCVGHAVLRAVERNEPYIVTHSQHKDQTKTRFDGIIDAFSHAEQRDAENPASARF